MSYIVLMSGVYEQKRQVSNCDGVHQLRMIGLNSSYILHIWWCSAVVATVQAFSGWLSSFNDSLEDEHINVLVQNCSNSIANTLELLQSWTNPSIYELTWLFNFKSWTNSKMRIVIWAVCIERIWHGVYILWVF